MTFGIRTAALVCALALCGCAAGPSLYMESQQDQLQRALAGTPVTVIRKGDSVILRMPSDVTFAVDRAEIAPGFYPVLDIMAGSIVRWDEAKVEVTGHADSTGTEAHNQALSERRAAAVGAYLAKKGVARARLRMAGLGETSPIATNDTDEGRAMNRRVEVVLQPIRLSAVTEPPT